MLDKLGKVFSHPSSDLAVVTVFTFAGIFLNLNTLLAAVPTENQRSAYSAAAGVTGSIAGFIVASTFFFAALDNRIANQLRRDFGPLLNRTLIGAFLSLVLCACAYVACTLATPMPIAAQLPPPPSPTPAAPSEVASTIFLPATALGVIKLVRVAFLAWGVLASQSEHSRNTPDAAR